MAGVGHGQELLPVTPKARSGLDSGHRSRKPVRPALPFGGAWAQALALLADLGGALARLPLLSPVQVALNRLLSRAVSAHGKQRTLMRVG